MSHDPEAALLGLLNEHPSLGNAKARQLLGLDETTYESLKARLLAQGLIATGRGRGGSIRLVPSTSSGTAGSMTASASPVPKPRPRPELVEGNGRAAKPQGSAFEQAFRNIDDILWKEAGCSNELDYTEQTSWIIFLKYLDDLEATKQMAAELKGERYTPLLNDEYRWPVWACPKGADGKIDHHQALTGPDLVDFVDRQLFPYLKGFKQRATGPNTIEYKIGEIFGELTNRVKSGYNLREILEAVDALHFQTSEEKHELSELYEAKIQRMGNAGRNGGEYYTPRPLIRAIVQVVDPRIGETVYDGAAGSAGFLCEAFAHMQAQAKRTSDHEVLQTRTFFAKEKKGLAYIIGIMNMILHGIEAPNIVHTNTLAENLQDIQPKDQRDVVLANPPFGGKERKEVQQNFPIKTGETAFLFLQHFIKSLKAGGRAGIVIKNTFLSNTDNASISLRRKLLEDCDLHTILDMPQGTFQGAGVKTVVLFFEKGRPTRRIWYYQLDPGRSLGKTNPLNEKDLAEFVQLARTKGESANSWSRSVAELVEATDTYDLSVKNPNRAEEAPLREPKAILEEMRKLDARTKELLDNIMGVIG
ncbi:MAG: N-6 DNA methylase [Flavobacteriales bacterium]|jgi:type I restriction enzyme M protein|nr:N-6 DNA methylase [Flavobacteriales bacterium]